MSLKVFGLKSCDTCRKTRKFLKDRDIVHDYHDVRDDGVNIQMLERWSAAVGWEALLNKRSLTWRKIPEVDRSDMNRSKALAAIIANPTLLKRPVIEGDGMLAIGFSEQKLAEFLDRRE